MPTEIWDKIVTDAEKSIYDMVDMIDSFADIKILEDKIKEKKAKLQKEYNSYEDTMLLKFKIKINNIGSKFDVMERYGIIKHVTKTKVGILVCKTADKINPHGEYCYDEKWYDGMYRESRKS